MRNETKRKETKRTRAESTNARASSARLIIRQPRNTWCTPSTDLNNGTLFRGLSPFITAAPAHARRRARSMWPSPKYKKGGDREKDGGVAEDDPADSVSMDRSTNRSASPSPPSSGPSSFNRDASRPHGGALLLRLADARARRVRRPRRRGRADAHARDERRRGGRAPSRAPSLRRVQRVGARRGWRIRRERGRI